MLLCPIFRAGMVSSCSTAAAAAAAGAQAAAAAAAATTCKQQLPWPCLRQLSTDSVTSDTHSTPMEEEDVVDFGFKAVPRQQKEALVGQVFSNVASSYDVMNDLMSGGLHRLWKDSLVATLAPFPGMQHLDVAGGTGDVAFRVLRAIQTAEAMQQQQQQPPGPPQQPVVQQQEQQQRGHVTVFDINADMLEVGRSRAQAQGLSSGLSWVQGNAEQLPFPDACLDSYTVAFGIRNVTNRHAALCEAHRVLKRGGRMLCLEFSHVSLPLLKQLYDLYSFNVIPKIGGLVAKDEASYQYLVESIRQFPSQESWADQIRDAGFRAVTFENLTGGVVAIHSGFKL